VTLLITERFDQVSDTGSVAPHAARVDRLASTREGAKVVVGYVRETTAFEQGSRPTVLALTRRRVLSDQTVSLYLPAALRSA
jgi:hypothetical protein